MISSPVECSPFPNCYLIVSPISPFPPVESCLCRPVCLNPGTFLVRLLIFGCSWRVMYLPEFLHGRPQQVPFKQFSEECWEAESVLLAAQERRNTSNTNLFKKLHFLPSQSSLADVGQESDVLYYICSLYPTARYSQYFCYHSL